MSEKSGRASFLADVLAHQGRFQEAARLYRENGEAQKAVAMYAGNVSDKNDRNIRRGK